jgi:uncharacterized membrane protein YeiB
MKASSNIMGDPKLNIQSSADLSETNDRLVAIEIVRGFAVLGVLPMSILSTGLHTAS